MNAVSELIRNRRKLVRDVACLAAEGRLFQRTIGTIGKAIFVMVSTWQWYRKLIILVLSESRKL